MRSELCGFHSTPNFLIVNNIVPLEINHKMISRVLRVRASSYRYRVVSSALAVSLFAIPGSVATRVPVEDAMAPSGRLITSAAIVCNPSTHKIYAVNEGVGSVTVINAATGARHIVEVGREPIAIALNRATNRIYVANDGSASVSMIDGASDTVIATIATSRLPYALAVDETANKVYVTHTYAGVVTAIDGMTNSAQELKVGDADGIVTDGGAHTVFLMTYEDPSIRIVDPATGAVTRVAVGPHLWGMVFDEPTSTLFLAHTSAGEVVVLDEKSHAVSTIPVGKIPCAVAINAVTRRLYTVNYGDETLSVIDLQTRKVIALIPVGKHPQGIAVDSAANRIYVANVHGDSVTVIDGGKNTVLGARSAGKNPYAVTVDEASGRAYAANYSAPWVTPVSDGR
jgi:YVTN family beta-propeller protein